MKHRIVQALSLAAATVCLASFASSVKNTNAATPEPRELYNNDNFYSRHYIYYTNGAMRSLNNYLGDTYNFDDDDEFAKNVAKLSSKFFPNVIYDDTEVLRDTAGNDCLTDLPSIYKMQSKKVVYYTNYSKKQLEEKGLLPDDDVAINGTEETDVSSFTSNIVDTGEATTSELTQAASYLIQNDYLTFPRSVKFYTAKSTLGPGGSMKINTDWMEPTDNMKKSDLVMTMGKIYYGVQKSSALVIEDYSYRDKKVWVTVDPLQDMKPKKAEKYFSNGKEGMNYYGFSKDVYGGDKNWKGETHKGVQFLGDYWVYYDPNVYELYLEKALADGIIQKSDLSSSGKTALKSSGWANGNIYTQKDYPKDIFGSSIKVNASEVKFALSSKEPNYFGENEEMTMIEALRLVEAYMRANDENMSKTEESIIQYKLGLDVLAYLDSDDQRTVTYLIATGILDGDNTKSLTGMLYNDATVSRLLPILYRVANKKARSDFKTIQLTDSETYWASQDFSANTMSIFETTDDIIHETGTVSLKKTRNKKPGSTTKTAFVDSEGDNHLLSASARDNPFVLEVSAAATVKTYNVTKYFDTDSVYCIGTTTIAKLAKSQDKSEMSKYSIKSISEEDDYVYRGKKHKVYKVVFEISALKQSDAIKMVEQKYSVMSDLDKYKKTISGVTSVQRNGSTVTLVSQKSLTQAFSNITVLEDKILMNNVTGTMAYFSYDNKIAIVGSQIIDNGYANIVKAGNEVYYNLAALLPLLSKAYVDTIGPQISIVVCDIEHTHNVKITTSLTDAEDYPLTAQYVKVYTKKSKSPNSGTGDDGEDENRYGFSCIATSNSKKELASTDHEINYFVKINSLSTAANKLTKSFKFNYNGTPFSGTIIVDLQYIVPDAGSFNSWLSSEVFSTGQLTYQEASQLMITPPDKINELKGFETSLQSMTDVQKSALNNWWYSNYAMSNALCNFMFGTEGYIYVHSGYITPSVTVLFDNVGNKSFEEWCNKGTKPKKRRDTILGHVFKNFALGKDYLKYNGGNSEKFWHNYYQIDASIPDYSSLGFQTADSDVTGFITSARRFSIYCQPGKKDLKLNKLGRIALDTSLKTYGTRYAVSASGCVYEDLETMGSSKQPMFKYTCNTKNGENSTLKTLKLTSRSAEKVKLNANQIVYLNNKAMRYYSTMSTSKTKYYAMYPNKVIVNNIFNPLNVKMQLVKSPAGTMYSPAIKSTNSSGNAVFVSPVSDDFYTRYKLHYASFFNQVTTCPSSDIVFSMIKSSKTNLFLDPTKLKNDLDSIIKVFGNGKNPIYIYTDKGKSNSLTLPGKIYKLENNELTLCDASDLTVLCNTSAEIIAIPLYLAPCDSFFFKVDETGRVILGQNAFSKALNYMQFDLTSLNNQLIEAYLDEQSGVKSISKLTDGAKVTIGDTVWVKKGKWFQSKPIRDPSNVQAAISDSEDMMWYSNKLFSGIYVTVQGRRYSLQAYVEEMTMGGSIGSKSQFKKGVIYKQGNRVKVRKGDNIKNANKKTIAQYLSVKAKFDDNLLVRPTNSDGTEFTLVGHSDRGLISSADYPFFDKEASWDKTNKNMFAISATKFKPSEAFKEAKEAFMHDFNQALLEDSWNYVWVIIICLASYLLIMSWFSYGVLTGGVGRAGFEALTMRDRAGNKKGIDFIKVATLGLYSLDKPLSLGRTVIVSFGCCIVIVVILTVIF